MAQALAHSKLQSKVSLMVLILIRQRLSKKRMLGDADCPESKRQCRQPQPYGRKIWDYDELSDKLSLSYRLNYKMSKDLFTQKPV